MSALFIYLAKVVLIQLVLYLIYRLAFHKSGRYDLNRGFIFCALILSFIIPFVDASSILPGNIEGEQIKARVWLENVEFQLADEELAPVKKAEAEVSYWVYLFRLLVGVSLLLFARSVIGYFQLAKILKHSELISKSWYKLYKSKIASPFSFFKHILLPEKLFSDASAFDQVLVHEAIHVKKWHSLDRTILEILICIFWFNPVLYLFKKALIETHEFQADQGVLHQFNDPICYQEVLYQQLTASSPAGVVSHFNYSTIKNRIKMMNKSKKASIWLYSFTMPAVLALAVIFSNNSAPEKLPDLSNEVVAPISEILSPTEQYRPSIFPLKEPLNSRLTADFVMRMHPVYKRKMMHKGIDLKTAEGNGVLATANGTITFAGEDGDYGIKIVIDHNGFYKTVYAHLSKLNVRKGDKVTRGDEIGLSGSTGASTAEHLHYEIIEAEKGHVNPLDFIDDYKFNSKSELNNEEKSTTPSKKYKVVIDPGHGGLDKGIGSSHLFEKEIVMNIAKLVATNFFESAQVEVVLTREDDRLVSLKDRIQLTQDADLFVSLHVEKHADKDADFMVPIYLYRGDYVKKSQRFAKLLAYEFGQMDKEVKVGNTSGYYVLENAKCPAVLFNLGFVSNLNADNYLNSEEGQIEVAKGLSDAIELAVL